MNGAAAAAASAPAKAVPPMTAASMPIGAALPENLIESELFGHVKGAFTGAVADKKGKVEAADRGTVFLDEIGEMPLELQVKLLRLIQQGEIAKVGAPGTTNVDVRIVAATHRDLKAMIDDGAFRA